MPVAFIPCLDFLPFYLPTPFEERKKENVIDPKLPPQPRKRNLEIGIARRARHHLSWYRESELTPRWRRQHLKKSSQLQKSRVYCNAFATVGSLRR
jgi:hypothetical protein